MRNVYLLGACRTPIGKFGGLLSNVSAVELGSIVTKEAIRRAGVDSVDHVYMGCVLQAGLGQNVARQVAINAGLPVTTTAETINAVCGSGLEAVNLAARMIQTFDADIVVAGGSESMSNAPYALQQARFGYRMGNAQIVDTMVNDALWDAFGDCHMGITAENICDKWQLSRYDLDKFAAYSQQKAIKAMGDGKFIDEIIAVEINQKKHNFLIDTDEGPRQGVSVETLSRLKPAFKEGGFVTAGNSSGISDGAAAVVLASEDKVKELGLKPLGRWCGGALGGCCPEIMGVGPVESTKKVLENLALNIDDIDLIEANEAFAAQTIAVARELRIPQEKLNVNGGAIALGHPVGASGCRILVTLLYEMQRRKAKYGLATLCIGGGMGCSVVVERCER